MSIRISSETEARFTDEARRQGISVDALLERLMKHAVLATKTEVIGRARELVSGEKRPPELPVLHLGAMGAFHRLDIYFGARVGILLRRLATVPQPPGRPSFQYLLLSGCAVNQDLCAF